MTCSRSNRLGFQLFLLIALSFAAAPLRAMDGGSFAAPDPPPEGEDSAALMRSTEAETNRTGSDLSYYQEMLQQGGPARAASLELGTPGGLPASLYMMPAVGNVEYHDRGDGRWTVEVTMGDRPQEKVDAVYDLVLALPLPVGAQTKSWRIPVRQGTASRSVPAIYAGEKIALKRNTPLETTWLPLLLSSGEGLPDLADSGYEWTLWDTIVRYDASAGSTVQGFGSLDYSAAAGAGAPDPDDPRNAAYVITWVPTLDASVPPYTLRLDVVAPE